MKLRTVIVALVLVVIGAAVWMTLHGVLVGSTPSKSDASSSIDPAKTDLEMPDAVRLDPARGADAQRALVIPAASTDASQAEPAKAIARIEARVVDESHEPIEGAKVSCSRARSTSPSDRDGRLAAEAELRVDEVVAESLEFTARGRATRSISTNLQCSRTTYLGDVVLQRGGSVSGIVVEEDGKPASGAEVGQERGDFGWPFAHIDTPKTKTAADGTFHLDGMPIGSQHLAASRLRPESTSFWTVLGDSPEIARSSDFQVQWGEETSGVRIALSPAKPQWRVDALVLDPDGAPVLQTTCFLETKRDSGSSIHDGRTDSDGRFKDFTEEDGEKVVYARDDQARFEDTDHVILHEGDNDVTLRFTTPRKMLDLTVTDETSAPLTRWSGECHSTSGDKIMDVPGGKHAGGVCTVGIPKVLFVLVLEAPGHAKATFGPFDPAALGPALTVVLRSQPSVQGRVVDVDGPARGVPVRLYFEGGAYTDSNGFVGVECSMRAGITSRDDGTFQFTPRENGRYTVRAEKADRAPAQVVDLIFDGQREIPDLVLSLSPGGAIEGRLLVDRGVDPTGSIVAVSRGDAFSLTQRVGPDGAFAFEHLVPGRWMVASTWKELREGNGADTTNVASSPKPPSNCEVFEGRTTRFDLDRREASRTCVLVGDLEFRGSGNNLWSATFAGGDPLGSPPAGFGMWGHQFKLATSTPGAAVVLLTATGGDLAGTTLTAPVVLKVGETHWQLTADQTTLELHGAGSQSSPDVPLVLVMPCDGGSTFVRPLPGKGVTSSEVPAGKGRVLWLDESVRRDEDPRTWSGGVEVTLEPHAKVSIERP